MRNYWITGFVAAAISGGDLGYADDFYWGGRTGDDSAVADHGVRMFRKSFFDSPADGDRCGQLSLVIHVVAAFQRSSGFAFQPGCVFFKKFLTHKS